MKKLLVLVGIFFLLFNISVSAEINLKELKGVYAGKNISPPDMRSIGELRGGYKRLYSKFLPILKQMPADSESAVILGEAALKAGLITRSELKKASPGGFVIKVVKNKIAIAGAYPWAARYGVGRFLEYLGCRFVKRFRLGVIANPVQKIDSLLIIDKPVFAYRNGHYGFLGEMMKEVADPRKGANPELFDRKKTGSDLWIDHSAAYLVPKLLYYDKHPEYYAMKKNGKRIAKDRFTDHRTPLCLSNPDVLKISAERAVKWVEKQPDKRFFFITYGDTPFWCLCPNCKKLDPEPGAYATRNLRWVNYVAEAVKKKYPKKTLFTFAYAGSDKPPVGIKPASNIRVVVAVGLGNYPFYEHARKYEKGYKNNWKKLTNWIKISHLAPLVCEYVGGTYQPVFIDQTAARYREYAKRGVGGIAFSYGQPKNFSSLWNYLHGKLLWNPNQDAMKLAKGYATNYYGTAAKPLCKYFELMHKQYQKTFKSGKKLVGLYPPDFYTEKYIKQCIACFDEAISAVKANPRLNKELKNEKLLFLKNALPHLGNYNLDNDNQALISYIIDEITKLAKLLKKDVETKKWADLTARSLAAKKHNPKLLSFIREKVGKSSGYVPDKINNGLRFSPAVFVGADYGPQKFGPAKSHPTLSCPEKLCAGVYAKGVGGRGNHTSTEMKLVFNLDSIPDGKSELELEGQDAVSKWAGKRQLKLMTSMLIKVNGKNIYNGECGFVRGNWSRRVFSIKSGILKTGENTITIKNVTKQTYGPFAACWVLISDIKLLFK